jgi:hypothetical protein
LKIEKWVDEVFIWSSENGNLTLEVPAGWYTPKRHGHDGKAPLREWKKKHQKELAEFKKLTGDRLILNEWRKEQQNKKLEMSKERLKIYWIVILLR